jgi:hypothetical protein
LEESIPLLPASRQWIAHQKKREEYRIKRGNKASIRRNEAFFHHQTHYASFESMPVPHALTNVCVPARIEEILIEEILQEGGGRRGYGRHSEVDRF